MKRCIKDNKALITTALIFAASVSEKALAQSPMADPKVGTTATITGCLHSGKGKNSFVLVGVTEKAAEGHVPVPYAIFWLDGLINETMRPLVGQMVAVTGLVAKRDEGRGKITIDVKADAEASTNVTVASPGKNPASTETYAGSGDSAMLVELSRPVYRMNVEKAVAVDFNKFGPACK